MASKKPKSVLTTGAVVGFGAFFAGLWLLWSHPIVLPLKLFVVFLHEISHGIAAVATGGRIERILIDLDQGGACYCGGGSSFVTLSAGYLGSLGWGLALTWLARFDRAAPWSVAAVGTATGLITLAFVRSATGFLFGIGFAALLFAASRRLSARWNSRVLYALGLTSALYAVLDIKSDIIDRPTIDSDARMLAELTGVPTIAWGVLWIGIALGTVYLVVRRALSGGTTRG